MLGYQRSNSSEVVIHTNPNRTDRRIPIYPHPIPSLLGVGSGGGGGGYKHITPILMGFGHLDCCWLEKGSIPHPQMCTVLNYPLKTSIICNLLCILIFSRTLAVISVPDLYQRSVLKTHFFHAMVNTPSSPIIHHMIYTSVHNHLSYIMTHSDADSVTVGVVMAALLLHKLHNDTL